MLYMVRMVLKFKNQIRKSRSLFDRLRELLVHIYITRLLCMTKCFISTSEAMFRSKISCFSMELSNIFLLLLMQSLCISVFVETYSTGKVVEMSYGFYGVDFARIHRFVRHFHSMKKFNTIIIKIKTNSTSNHG